MPGGSQTRPWLYGVARRVLANHRRGEGRRNALADRLRGELAETAQPEHLPSDSTAAVAFRELPEQDRELLSLVAWEELDAVTRGLAPATGNRVSSETWAGLSDSITATAVDTPAVEAPVVVRARPKLVVVGAFSLLIVGAVAATLLNRPGQDLPQALSVTDQGNWLTVRVVDQDADPARYNEQFKRSGRWASTCR